MKKSKNYLFLILFLVLGVTFTYAWEKAPNTIWTTWGENINPNTTLQEYPRPQMERGNWVNLNGVWRCREGSAGEAVPVGSNLSQDILVPFPIQSALSGVKQNWHRFWYRRTFTVPSGWSGQRVLLHFGAVDWESEVYINGASVGIHKGGYDPFEYDITDRLNGGTNELIVRIYDPTDADGEPGPTGKQQDARWNSTNGIWYTPSSGIWQTVWMEAVPATSIRSLKLIPNIDNSTLAVTVTTSGSTSGITVEAIAYDGSAVAGSVTGNANTQLTLPISNQKLWSPSSPFLYSLTVSLRSGSTNVDSVNSYFGMRKISRGSVGGVTKMLLNNSFLFEMGPLDQGFWPDGIYTAPSDAAIIFDIQGMKDLGYNMVRKHIKVEPERWYYHCDRLGLLVWQDMPNGSNNTTEKQNQFRTELERMINTHINHPSIIMWVTFNEQWGIFDSVNIANYAKSLDSSRLVDENSACGSGGSTVGDVRDYHYYSPPGCPAPDSRALACGEYGGLVLVKTGNMWDPNYYSTWALMTNSDSEFTTTYVNYCNQIVSLRDNSGLSAAVYTQWTDVEGELNGNYTYDRKVFKGDRASIRAALQATYSGAGTPVNPPAGTVAWESYNYRSYFIRHQDSRGRISNVISPIEDAYWRMIPGLAGAGVSFESVNYPGMYLRHTNSEIWLYASDGTALFN
ncbi:MAG: AbfB domain-containing protein, partial [Spirochaetales bacterium]|nr:AbfB domain-containing protein [Spirochaetales bacterium]